MFLETILVLEDDEPLRSALIRMLKQLGYPTIEAASASAAVALLKDHPGQIHLLVADEQRLGVSSAALAKQVQSLRPGVKLLLLSASPNAASPLLRSGASLDELPSLSALSWKLRTVLDEP